ncbi:MAG: hypothetical protein HRU27_09970 [Rhizobiaceae bacterium]|nr:zinc-ribbon domain-containing protein [Hyphomicrobiales bacterium]NRB30909.1 hypothetical protein [Rhizobiaceae bacterium]
MTVVCPACEARFRDPPEHVLKTRTLQCSKCEHEWKIEDDKPARIKMDAPSLAPEMANLTDGKEPIETNLPVVMPKNDKPAPIYVDRAPEEAPVSRRSLMLPAAVLACLVIAASGVALRDMVMKAVPQTVALYQAVGLTSQNPDLQIGNVVTTKIDKDGIRQLIIKGEIQNVADNTVPVPPVKLIMRGEEKANLFAWTVSANKDTLKAGETGKFTAVAHDFPAETVNVDIELMPLKVLDKATATPSE